MKKKNVKTKIIAIMTERRLLLYIWNKLNIYYTNINKNHFKENEKNSQQQKKC